MPSIRAVLCDIEGTTSPITFVKNVLFPYARERVQTYIDSHRHLSTVRMLVDQVALDSGCSPDSASVAAELRTWIDADSKATVLKELQGLIWEDGYRRAELKAPVYEDALRCLKAWQARGLELHIYSSGSVHAQKLLFGHTEHGSLLGLFSGYFDTTSGNKRDSAAYTRIANEIAVEASCILFLSDVTAELDAARLAGLRTTWIVRPQDTPLTAEARAASVHAIASTFDEVRID